MIANGKVTNYNLDIYATLTRSHHPRGYCSPKEMADRPVSTLDISPSRIDFQFKQPIDYLRSAHNIGIRQTVGVQDSFLPKKYNNGRASVKIEGGHSQMPTQRIPLKHRDLGQKGEEEVSQRAKFQKTEGAAGVSLKNNVENRQPLFNKIMQKLTDKQKLINQLKKLAQTELPIRSKKSSSELKKMTSFKEQQTEATLSSQSFITPLDIRTEVRLEENKERPLAFSRKEEILKPTNLEDKKRLADKKGLFYTPKANKDSKQFSSTAQISYTSSPINGGKPSQKGDSSLINAKKECLYGSHSPFSKGKLFFSKEKSGSPVISSKLASSKYATSLSLSDFKIVRTLGQGKFGTVLAAVHIESGFLFALKRISKSVIKSNLMVEQLAVEIRIQSFCNSRHIIKLYDCFDDKDYLYLVLEYMQDGTLFDFLKRNKTLKERDAAEKVRQVAEAVKYLQDHGIAHRDIKPENIVLSNGVGKLCDFGWAAICNERRRTYCGTFDYAAPQILQGNQYDMSVDLWCLGVLAYQLLVGKAPFYHISRKETMKKIMSVDSQSLNFPSELSSCAVSFIKNLLKKQPQERMTIDAVLSHSFLSESKGL